MRVERGGERVSFSQLSHHTSLYTCVVQIAVLLFLIACEYGFLDAMWTSHIKENSSKHRMWRYIHPPLSWAYTQRYSSYFHYTILNRQGSLCIMSYKRIHYTKQVSLSFRITITFYTTALLNARFWLVKDIDCFFPHNSGSDSSICKATLQFL